jgi:hypothetical protein
MSVFPEGAPGIGDHWLPSATNFAHREIDPFDKDMRQRAVALLKDYGQLERMPKHQVVERAIVSFALAGGLSDLPPIGDQTFVAAPVDIRGLHGLVAVTTWTFRSLENTGEISVFREGTENNLSLQKGLARINDPKRVGLQSLSSQDRIDWEHTLHGLEVTAREHPELLMPVLPIDVSYRYANPVSKMLRSLDRE